MPVNHRNSFSARRVAVLLIALAAHPAIWTSTTASAEGLFELLFGSTPREPAPPQPVLSYANPAAPSTPSRPAPLSAGTTGIQPSAGSTQGAAYCVRLCDGRFFPIVRRGAANTVELCHAFCPSSPTKVFSGGNIAHAVATDGSRYGRLTNAFVFRMTLVPNCTCNGEDHFGLARIDANTDPTLRLGDIVATANGRATVAVVRPDRTGSIRVSLYPANVRTDANH